MRNNEIGSVVRRSYEVSVSCTRCVYTMFRANLIRIKYSYNSLLRRHATGKKIIVFHQIYLQFGSNLKNVAA
jgi:hypothetical protein